MKLTKRTKEILVTSWMFSISLIGAIGAMLYMYTNLDSESARVMFLSPTILTFSFIGIVIGLDSFERIHYNRRPNVDRIIDLEARVAELEGRDRE